MMPSFMANGSRHLLRGWLLGVLSLACGQPETTPQVEYVEQAKYLRKLDLLLVVDPTAASDGTQSLALAQRVVESLHRVDGGLPDVHIAMVSSELAVDGFENCSGGRMMPGRLSAP